MKEYECTCDDRSWHGEDHDTQCKADNAEPKGTQVKDVYALAERGKELADQYLNGNRTHVARECHGNAALTAFTINYILDGGTYSERYKEVGKLAVLLAAVAGE